VLIEVMQENPQCLSSPIMNTCRMLNSEMKRLRKKRTTRISRFVEVCHSWLNRFSKILIRVEKLTVRYEALLHMAAAIIAYRKIGIIYE